MSERDYLVIFEEPDPDGLPEDDSLVLDIEEGRSLRPEVDVRQIVDLELSNTTNRMGVIGFGVTVLGAIMGMALTLFVLFTYPGSWYDAAGNIRASGAPRLVIPLGAISMLVMIAGTVMTHYGKRIEARGNLSDVRIIEKSSQNRIELE